MDSLVSNGDNDPGSRQLDSSKVPLPISLPCLGLLGHEDHARMELSQFVLDIGVAVALGMAIGLERQLGQHPAGLRTNTLVSLGAALFVVLARLVTGESSPTRIAGQVVTGIGFLGGGVILREGFNVRGMNTAATLWCTAAIGVLAGSGFVREAGLGAAAIILIHLALRPIVDRLDAFTKAKLAVEALYRLRVVCNTSETAAVRDLCMRHVNSHAHMTVHGVALEPTDGKEKSAINVDIYSTGHTDKDMNDLLSSLTVEPSVTAASWQKVH